MDKSKISIKRQLSMMMCLALVWILAGCNGDNGGNGLDGDGNTSNIVKGEKPLLPSLNVLVLLDLSDRLIAQEGQPSRDQQLLEYICGLMPAIMRDRNGIDKSQETIKIQIADQDNIPYSTRQYADSLYFKMSKSVRGGYPVVRRIMEGRFKRNLNQLYKSAVFSNNSSDYKGAHISRYFMNDLKSDVKPDSLNENLLFIVTDGYVVVGDKGNVMLEANAQFPNLKVMLLEVALRDRDYEMDRLRSAWDRWFEELGIEGYAMSYNTAAVERVKEDITKFLRLELQLVKPGQSIPAPNLEPIAIADPDPQTPNTNKTPVHNPDEPEPETKSVLEIPTTLVGCLELLASEDLAEGETIIAEALKYFESSDALVTTIRNGVATRNQSVSDFLNRLYIQKEKIILVNDKIRKNDTGKIIELYVTEN